MIRKPSSLALSGMALLSAAILVACNCAPILRYITVAPVSGEIYVSGAVGAGAKGAVRHAPRPAQQTTRKSVARPAISLQPATASPCSLQYAATGLYSDGTSQDKSSLVTWSSSSPSVAGVSSTGLVTGIALGTTNIGASLGSIVATSEPLTVDQLNSITLLPGSTSVPAGSVVPFVADGNFTFAAGGSGDLDVSAQVTWNSSNLTVATIDGSGNATTLTTGSTTITATSCDGFTVGTATLTVTPAAANGLVVTPATITISTGTTTLFTAMETLSDGSTQPPQNPITWSSDTLGVATIGANSGVALGLTAGSATITATEAALSLTGTATLTVQAAAARFAYVGNIIGTPGGGSISGYSVTPATAALATLSGSEFSAHSPQQVLIHPSGDLLYYIDTGSSIQTNFIDSVAGGLTTTGRTNLAGSGGINAGVIDPLGRFIYVIDDGSSSGTPTIFGYSIAQTTTQSTNGLLTAIPGFGPPSGYTDGTLNAPSWVLTDSTGKFLYVVNSGNNTISEYAITQTGASAGALSPLGTATISTGAGSSPLFATIDVHSHLFVANIGDNTVSVFSIDTSSGATAGELTQVGSNFSVTGATTVYNVLTDPTGKYLYVLDSPGNVAGQVFAFNLNTSTGAIGAQIGTAQPTGKNSTGMAIDPTGVMLAIDNNSDATISLYTVGSNGAPTPASPATAPTGAAPYFVVFYTAASGQ